jgi:hypothetical protein
MLMASGGDKVKAVTSLLEAAVPAPSANSAVLAEDPALTLVVVLVAALLMVDLITASSSTPVLTTIVTTAKLMPMLDFPMLRLMVEARTVSASLVL